MQPELEIDQRNAEGEVCERELNASCFGIDSPSVHLGRCDRFLLGSSISDSRMASRLTAPPSYGKLRQFCLSLFRSMGASTNEPEGEMRMRNTAVRQRVALVLAGNAVMAYALGGCTSSSRSAHQTKSLECGLSKCRNAISPKLHLSTATCHPEGLAFGAGCVRIYCRCCGSSYKWAMRDSNPRPPRCKRGALAN